MKAEVLPMPKAVGSMQYPAPLQVATVAIALVTLVVLPFPLGPYWRGALIIFVINCLSLTGYRVITTMGGWSFAHVAIGGIGAYTTAILTTSAHPWPFWATVPLGVGICAVAALVLAYPVLRTKSYYFFLATFAAAEAFRQCFIKFTALTNGNSGIAFIPRPEGFGLFHFDNNISYYFLCLAIFVVVTSALVMFDRSVTGRTIKATAENPDVSESIGIDTWRYRSLAFVLGSAVAGLAGILLTSFNGAINPSDFGSSNMFKIVAAAIVGGTTTVSGPILGLLYLTIVEELFRNTADFVPLIWGISVILILLKTKGGLEMLLPKSWNGGTQ